MSAKVVAHILPLLQRHTTLRYATVGRASGKADDVVVHDREGASGAPHFGVSVPPAIALHDACIVKESIRVIGEKSLVTEADEHARPNCESVYVVVRDVIVTPKVALVSAYEVWW